MNSNTSDSNHEHVRVLLFDIDGTLIDSGGAGKLAMETALAQEFGITAPTHGVPYAGRTDGAIMRDLLAHHGVSGNETDYQRLRNTYLGLLHETLPRKNGWVLAGVRELLNALRGKPDIVLALLTGNIKEGAHRKLRFFDLDHYFVCGGFADGHVERDDVARHAVCQVEAHLGQAITPDNFWVIGDTPHDVRCARVIGGKALAVATGQHTLAELQPSIIAGDHLAADLTDTARLLALWS